MNRKKKLLLGILIISIIFYFTHLNNRPQYINSTAQVIVISKNNDQVYSFLASDSYDGEEYLIHVSEENLWNLIKENEEYFIVYHEKSDSYKTLLQIKYID